MSEERLQALYHRAMERRAQQPGGCQIPPETMVEVLTGRLPEVERQRVLLAIMSDPRCRQEFELLGAVVEGAAPKEVSQPRLARWTRPLRVAAAVALLIGAGVVWRAWPGPESTRDAGEPGELLLVEPESGTRPASDLRFVWRSAPGALHYEYNLVTKEGRLVFSTTLADTALTLPPQDSLPVSPDDELRWWVEATLADGHQARSALRRLKIASP